MVKKDWVRTRKSVRYEFLHKYGKNRVFTKKEADLFFNYNSQISLELIMKNGLATRVRRGLYYIYNWGEKTIEQHRDFFVPYLGNFVVGYWSALKEDTKDVYLLSTRKQKVDNEVINGINHHFIQVSSNYVKKTYEKNGVKYLNKDVALIHCILEPQFTPGEKVLEEYIMNEVDIDVLLQSPELLKGNFSKQVKKQVADYLLKLKELKAKRDTEN